MMTYHVRDLFSPIRILHIGYSVKEERRWKMAAVSSRTFIDFSTSPPQSDCSEIRNGFHTGFRLFFTTCTTAQINKTHQLTVCPAITSLIKKMHLLTVLIVCHHRSRKSLIIMNIDPESKLQNQHIHTSVLCASCQPVSVCL